MIIIFRQCFKYTENTFTDIISFNYHNNSLEYRYYYSPYFTCRRLGLRDIQRLVLGHIVKESKDSISSFGSRYAFPTMICHRSLHLSTTLLQKPVGYRLQREFYHTGLSRLYSGDIILVIPTKQLMLMVDVGQSSQNKVKFTKCLSEIRVEIICLLIL